MTGVMQRWAALLTLAVTVGVVVPACRLQGQAVPPGLSAEGDIMIGGVFSIHRGTEERIHSYTYKPQAPSCFSLNYREFQFVQAMLFAIEEINNRTDLLPKVSLGYKIYDACGSILLAIQSAMALINGYEESVTDASCSRPAVVQAIIGESGSSRTIALSSVVGPFSLPLKPGSKCSESCPPGTRKAVQRGKPVCCYDCVPCADGTVSNATETLRIYHLCTSIPVFFYPWKWPFWLFMLHCLWRIHVDSAFIVKKRTLSHSRLRKERKLLTSTQKLQSNEKVHF
ncbi:extracellular calcium-sensing receptor-like isoform X12 [Brienomyrus brachyistius]|uniref:extracellular calcium-sensing receptor-like isoform X11 n=1 Tax=Brienomyrus brachyistius TaxID=42636 RepID=UPI0020B3140C|nr:extracellular calcium-sensing receptor-like isoform X11 [Brienomyrus brachyistius]XP_048837879.1 extracellular calcium-sensing receptor-like isoform X12 [Brienomyrus brachyistius]